MTTNRAEFIKMVAEKRSIDPNTVYISFTGRNEQTVKAVDEFVRMLEEKNIPHKVSIKEDIESISEFEQEVGKGKIIVVFYSPDYFKSYHCMNEYAMIRENENEKRIYTFKCVDCKFDALTNDLEDYWYLEQLHASKKKYEDLTEDKKAAYQNKFYIDQDEHLKTHSISIFQLENFFRNNQCKKDLKTLFECVVNIYNSASSKNNHFAVYPSNSIVYTSLDDIDFNKIVFSYNRPKNKIFFGRESFVKKIHDSFFEKGENNLNVIATGGMGKTSVAHIYIEKFREDYDEIEFVTSNNDICNDFNDALRDCIKIKQPVYDNFFTQSPENGAHIITRQIDFVLGKASTAKNNLLIIDVNVDKEGLDALNLNYAEKKWHILYLSRKRINGTINNGFELSSFENDFEGAKGLFNSIYQNDWNDDKLIELFKTVYFHPLLIEHLAAYGVRGQRIKTYEELKEVVSENRIKNASIHKRYSAYSTCFVDKDKTKDICVYLSQLFIWDDYSEDEKYILQHFILWPYNYIPIDTINTLLKTDYVTDWEGTLLDLTDKVVFSQSENGYRIHGLLADTLKAESLVFDYTNYIDNVKKLVKLGKDVDNDTKSCIRFTPINIFVNEKKLSVFDDCLFLIGLASIRQNDTEFSEIVYKVKYFKNLYNYSVKEIFDKLNGEYKDKSSQCVYIDWLKTQKGYNDTIPSDGIIKFTGKDGKEHLFKMIFVDGGTFKMGADNDTERSKPIHNVTVKSFYIGETQVTQGLWNSVMGTENNHFNKRICGENFAMNYVSWYDCLDFIIELNRLTHLIFRLPTEAEWEFAARGGNKSSGYEYSGSNDVCEVAWLGCFGEKHPIVTEEYAYPVKQKKSNELGIFDMSGNIYEWCKDWYDKDYYKKCAHNPPLSINPYNEIPIKDENLGCSGRVMRGGAWSVIGPYYMRVYSRSWSNPSSCVFSFGFRLAL